MDDGEASIGRRDGAGSGTGADGGAGSLFLTFDDGPAPTTTPAVLTTLRVHDAAATFFVLGERVREAPVLLDAILAAGHRVELHADRHVRHTDLDRGAIAADARAALSALAVHDVHPRWWRVPWGVVTDDSRAVADDLGLALIGWDADTHDWRGDDAAAMLATVVRARAGRPSARTADHAEPPHGTVVLAHDGLGPGARRTDCSETAAFAGQAVRWARDRGIRVAPLPDPAMPAGGAAGGDDADPRAGARPRPAVVGSPA